jgi:hypothetical protein
MGVEINSKKKECFAAVIHRSNRFKKDEVIPLVNCIFFLKPTPDW